MLGVKENLGKEILKENINGKINSFRLSFLFLSK
jgi:hypothetical protein